MKLTIQIRLIPDADQAAQLKYDSSAIPGPSTKELRRKPRRNCRK